MHPRGDAVRLATSLEGVGIGVGPVPVGTPSAFRLKSAVAL